MESVNEFTRITQGLHYGGPGALRARAAPGRAGPGRTPCQLLRLGLLHGAAPLLALFTARSSREQRQTLRGCASFPCPAADPQNQKSMVRTKQDGSVPFSDGFHTMALDWEAGRITRELRMPFVGRAAARLGGRRLHGGARFRSASGSAAPLPGSRPNPATPLPPRCLTVSVDGRVAKSFLPREKDPEGGWWTDAAGAPPNAPFNDPFYLIL